MTKKWISLLLLAALCLSLAAPALASGEAKEPALLKAEEEALPATAEDPDEADETPAADGEDYGPVSGAGDFTTKEGTFHWSYAGGTLTITGTGELTDLPGSSLLADAMDDFYASDVNVIYISGGITSIGGKFGYNETYKPARLRIGGSVEVFAPTNYDLEAETVVFDKGVREIGNGAFWQSKSLKHVVLPSSLRIIGETAFKGCVNLESAEIAEGLETIGETAFGSCKALESIVIPSTVTTIGKYAFDGCSGLCTAELRGGGTLKDSCFRNCTMLESVTFGPGVTEIGMSVFTGCLKLETADMSGSAITMISSSAFSGCLSLEHLTFSPTLKKIWYTAFKNCVLLQELTFPEGIETIRGFDYCSSLREIVIPASAKIIGGFQHCTGLQSVTILDGEDKTIDKEAFRECTGLTTVRLGANVTSIGLGAFYGCTALEELTLSPGLTTLDESAFSECSSLRSISIPDGVTQLPYDLFLGCTSLTTLTLGAGLTDYTCFCDNGGFTPLRADFVKNVYVSETNEALISIDGVVYTKDGVLFWYPGGRRDLRYDRPESATGIGFFAFDSSAEEPAPAPALETLVIPVGVKSFDIDYRYHSLDAVRDIWYGGTRNTLLSAKTARGYENYLAKLCKNSATVTFHFGELLPGDVNGDGTVDLMDTVLLLRGLETGIFPDAAADADADKNGVVDVMDAVRTLKITVGLIVIP